MGRGYTKVPSQPRTDASVGSSPARRSLTAAARSVLAERCVVLCHTNGRVADTASRPASQRLEPRVVAPVERRPAIVGQDRQVPLVRSHRYRFPASPTPCP